MKVYLVRHAIAENHPTIPDPPRIGATKAKAKILGSYGDPERALTEEGKTKMTRGAQGLRKLKVGLDLVLSSPLRRARETAEIVAQELGGLKVEIAQALAPGGEPSEVVALLRRHHNLHAMAVVGHEPDLGQLTSFLLTGSTDACHISFKKGGVACLDGDFDEDSAACSLLWLMPPKMLRSL